MLTKTEKTLAIYNKRGKEQKKLQRVYRELFKPELYELAYAGIYANLGATSKGIGKESLDGMSTKRIDKIIEEIKSERYKWRPVRRTYISKGNGEKRPLGIPSGDDKILQAAMKLLLESYYEPTFSIRSHGFRPQRGCLTALMQVAQKHQAATWFIEGDIKGCFDNIDHEILIKIMGEKIEDGRILSLTQKLLKAGHMEEERKRTPYSGTPQGGIISPLLTNIYLDKMDKWVEKELLPKYNRSHNGRRRCNPAYKSISGKMARARKRNDIETYKALDRQKKKVPSVRVTDEEYRKLEYVRYADDFILSFTGPKKEAQEIKEEIREFLKDTLKLELSEKKTLITHAKTERAMFLGYEISIFQSEDRRTMNGKIRFGIPKEVIKEAIRKYTKKGKPVHRAALLKESDLEIIWTYQSEYKGLVEYYRMAHNITALAKVNWLAKSSLLKTLAGKHKSSSIKMIKKYQETTKIEGKSYKVLIARVERKGKRPITATYGAVSLARNPKPAQLTDRTPIPFRASRSQLIERLKADECEMCGEKRQSRNTPREKTERRGQTR